MIAERVPGIRSQKEVAADLGMNEAQLSRLLAALQGAGLVYRADAVPATLSGSKYRPSARSLARSR